MNLSSVIRSSIFIVASSACVSLSAQTLSKTENLSRSPSEAKRSTLSGTVNRLSRVSEAPQPLLSDLSKRPTRRELESIRIDGLALTYASNSQRLDGKEEEILGVALKLYVARSQSIDATALEGYISENPASPWVPSLKITVGKHLYHQGRFSEALAHFEESWNALKGSNDQRVIEASVSAAAELAGLYARLGRMDELEAVLEAIEGRPIAGPATEKIRNAAEGLDSMKSRPEHSFKCGPFALRNIRENLGLHPASHPCINEKKSTSRGISLAELERMADVMEMDWVAAEREAGAELPLPALVHWKLGHYAVVLKKSDDGRLLVRDPTFLHDFLIAPDVLTQESSGRFLVPRTVIGKGWNLLSNNEAETVLGKGAPTTKDSDDTEDCETTCSGMAVYDFDLFKAGLIIRDTPLWYNPPYGQSIEFNLTYRQRGEHELSNFGFGSKWTTNWSSYLQWDDAIANMIAILPGGGRESHRFLWDDNYERQKRSLSKLVKTSSSPVIYELQHSDGSKYVFSREVAAGPFPKYLLASMSDAYGNIVTLNYDHLNRLITVTDALGQVSNFYYENAAYPNLVTKISDPFIPSGGIRRSAHFSYDSSGRLIKITDAAGIESSFVYHPIQTDFVASMTTPYGTTSFTTNSPTSGNIQYLEVSDPIGRKERIEYRNTFKAEGGFDANIETSDDEDDLPDQSLIKIQNEYLYYGSTLHWDKKTYVHYPPNSTSGLNYDKAVQYRWMNSDLKEFQTVGVIANIKKPDESRIWYEYPDQIAGHSGNQLGGSELPSKIGRLVGGETQVEKFEYNSLGNITKRTDPEGRITKWEYDEDTEMDLLSVKQQGLTQDETIVSFSYDASDPPHLPRVMTDASGQETTFAWNSKGQLIGVTQPGNLITSLNYYSNGNLKEIDGPLDGTSDKTIFDYDDYGRVDTIERAGNHIVSYKYDALDRPTLVTHPDGTTEQFIYEQEGRKILDLTRYKDRENRWSRSRYNALRERVWAMDPLGQVTEYNWCYCGALQDLFDAEGNHTQWAYNISGQLTAKTYADGKQVNYTYDAAGRLSTITDAIGQVKTYSYYKDDQLAGIEYTETTHVTPNVSFSYDPVYGRLSQMTDGTGVTSYTYHPVDGVTLGAGNLDVVNGPLANDTVTRTYDELGRLKSQSINGAANTTTVNQYDKLGRVTQLTNSLGIFNHTYNPTNLLPETITAPNGLSTEYFYHPKAGDFRLQEIKYQLDSDPLSSHSYTYSPEGNIKSWTQSIGSNPGNTWKFSYDNADQLESAILSSASSVPIKQHAWRFDKIGNRVGSQKDGLNTQSIYNNRNQLISEQAGGWLQVRGSTDKLANVKIRSNTNPFKQASISPDNEFSGWVETVPGINTLTIEAKDTSPNSNTNTRSYTFDVPNNSRAPTYDLNGNTLSNGRGQTYEWDAENRLIKITYADNTSTAFVYDGLSRRVQITEFDGLNVATSDKRYVWAGGNQPAEERDAVSNETLKQYHSQGEVILSASPITKIYYTRDHLGSVRQQIADNGTGVAIRGYSNYDYDLWGKREIQSGSIDTDVGYTGHHYHAKSGLILTWYRAYDPDAGRWLSPDPIEEEGGLNLYAYVLNNPINLIDEKGQNAIRIIINALKTIKSAKSAKKSKEAADKAKKAQEAAAKSRDAAIKARDAARKKCEAAMNAQKEDRAQLDNGRRLIAELRAQGQKPNPHGLQMEVEELLPNRIANRERRINQLLDQIKELDKKCQ